MWYALSMAIALIQLGVSIACTLCLSQPEIPKTFEAGQERRLQIRGLEESFDATGKLLSQKPRRNDALVRVLEVKDDCWTVEIDAQPLIQEDAKQEVRNDITKAWKEIHRPMRVRVGRDGSLKILNFDEVRRSTIDIRRWAMEKSGLAAKNPEAFQKVIKAFELLLSDPDAANNTLVSEYQPIFAHIGKSLSTEKQEDTVAAPAPMGDGQITTHRTTTVSPQPDGTRLLRVVLHPDERAIEQLMVDAAKRVNGPPLESPERLKSVTTLDVVVDVEDGWPQCATTTIEVEIEMKGEIRKTKAKTVFVWADMMKSAAPSTESIGSSR
jgi:hypothetical protein